MVLAGEGQLAREDAVKIKQCCVCEICERAKSFSEVVVKGKKSFVENALSAVHLSQAA